MPLYEYQCRSCKKVTEVRHGFKEMFDGPCPACGGEVARVFSPAPILFKGSGFYVTDSRKKSEAATGTSAPAKTDAAPAAKADGAAAATPAPAPAAGTTPASPTSSSSETAA